MFDAINNKMYVPLYDKQTKLSGESRLIFLVKFIFTLRNDNNNK